MTEYPRGFMVTPDKRSVPVNIISMKHPVKQARRTFNVPLVDKSGIRFLAETITERIDNNRDCMVLWTGDRGAGKTTGIAHVALEVNPKLPLEAVVFWLEDFGKRLSSNPQGGYNEKLGRSLYPQVILDEAGHALYGPQWLAREQLEIAKNMIINRVMRQIIHVAVPKRKQFNNQIRDMAYIWVHVSEPVEYKQGFAVVRLAPPRSQSEFFSEKYWEPKMAFIYPEMTGEWWDAYERKKIEFVRKASEDMGKAKSASSKFQAQRDLILKEYYTYRKRKGDPISYAELGEIVGLAKGTLSDILGEA